MKTLAIILTLLFTSPAFAGGNSGAFSGAHGTIDEPATTQASPVQTSPVVEQEQEAEFKINEALYNESIGSNNGYYGGGFYGEESDDALIVYYAITSGDNISGVRRGFDGGSFSFGGSGIHVGGFSFVHGGFGFAHR